jgi:hypothetical protein
VRSNAQRYDEGRLAAAKAPDGDRRLGVGASPDMPLPGREPVEGLEHRAISNRLEAPPLGLDSGEIAIDA